MNAENKGAPQLLGIERAVLAAMSEERAVAETVIAAGVTCEHFTSQAHRECFAGIDRQYQELGGPCTSVEPLKRAGIDTDPSPAALVGTPNLLSNAIRALKKARSERESAELVRRAVVAASERDDLDEAAALVLRAKAKRREGEDREPFGVPFIAIGEHGSLTELPPQREFLLTHEGRGMLPRGIVGMLAAAGGIGKTAMLLLLALCIVTGRRFLGIYDVAATGYVLLVLGEETIEEALRRLHYAALQLGLTAEEYALAARMIVVLPLHGIRCAFTDANSEPTAALTDLRDRLVSSGLQWALVGIDPLSRFAGAETEKDNSAATRFVQAAEPLATVPGNPAVIFSHHTTKVSRRGEDRGANASRGASGLTDAMRWMAEISADGDGDRVTFRICKSNYTAKPPPLELERDEHGALHAAERSHGHGDSRTSPYAQLKPVVLDAVGRNPGVSADALRLQINKRNTDVRGALGLLEREGLIRKDAKNKWFLAHSG